MKDIELLFENNKKFVEHWLNVDENYFKNLAKLQSPKFLWIGCADSRVPANEITGLNPGEVFVHRNIANVVVHTDMNCLSVIQYAVKVLKVEHILVVGHYGCGGVKAAMGSDKFGLIDNWLRHIKDVYRMHEDELDAVKDENERFKLLCELNVKEQVLNVCNTSIAQKAWTEGQKLSIHGWIFDVADGIIHDLDVSVSDASQINKIYQYK
ncbi:carbonate dehydratase [Solitalea canadensis]|uniref:Carbonic anhydrase n=1 Tax=Solitalea canadensis (strain ATCC 29591 / DSM 3403 / JCM 21819 / LMG 8368 / NBRC 15130 / NCIMB 12057 / USAM 9D) TaxID=929556 RepID=H8KQQ6_SOLCM|nr:carbonate dehydratase [Solitalea canadensis]AFD06927.1 carbonic anhydrase [Solitalea canadensis DSM 3403]